MQRQTEGFTIIEILIALALLSIIVLIVLGSLNGFFGLSRQTTGQSTLTNQAQAALEEVRGQWQDANAYANACIQVPTAGQAPNGATISVLDENLSGSPVTGVAYTPVYVTDCTLSTVVAPAGATKPPSPLRRVTVTTTSSNTTPAQSSTLVMEIAQ